MSIRFGIFLVENKYITANQFVSLVKKQLEKREAIGQTAMRNGLMDVEQVYQTLSLQSKKEYLSFGKAAIQLGFLTTTQYSQLLVAQAKNDVDIKELIIGNGWISRSRLKQLLKQFRMGSSFEDRVPPGRPKRPNIGKLSKKSASRKMSMEDAI